MKKLFLIILPIFCLLISCHAEEKNKGKDWLPLIEAIIKVESNGNDSAISKGGGCVGCLQIKKILVDDCNQWVRKKNKINGTNIPEFTYNDRYNREKSIEMFLIVQERWNPIFNPTDNDSIACYIWNQGLHYKKTKEKIILAEKYMQKVMKYYNKREVE